MKYITFTILASVLSAGAFAQTNSTPSPSPVIATAAIPPKHEMAEHRQLREDIRNPHSQSLAEHRAAFAKHLTAQRTLENRQLALMDKTIAMEKQGKLSPAQRTELQAEKTQLHNEFESLHHAGRQMREHPHN
ncbi:MAG: hypothetical protein Q7S87_08540 [Agitococcus sp.]|nr:hypothetical protein [Agitococcus sp.]